MIIYPLYLDSNPRIPSSTTCSGFGPVAGGTANRLSVLFTFQSPRSCLMGEQQPTTIPSCHHFYCMHGRGPAGRNSTQSSKSDGTGFVPSGTGVVIALKRQTAQHISCARAHHANTTLSQHSRSVNSELHHYSRWRQHTRRKKKRKRKRKKKPLNYVLAINCDLLHARSIMRLTLLSLLQLLLLVMIISG